ncbi:hypothetical protein Tco_0449759 [Tanacetum coccineum]
MVYLYRGFGLETLPSKAVLNPIKRLTAITHGGLIEKGITTLFKGRWKDTKSNFKRHEFVLRGGYKEPIKIISSKVNRSKQLYSLNQETKSYAQSRYEENKMIELREAQEGRDTPMTVDGILSEVPVPSLLNPAQFMNVVQDALEDDVAPGDDIALGDE